MKSPVFLANEFSLLKHNKEKEEWLSRNVKPINFTMYPFITRENGYVVYGMLDNESVLVEVDYTLMVMNKRELMDKGDYVENY